jgi:hypothetical protein
MAKFVVKDAVITVSGVALSDHVSEVTVTLHVDDVEVTSMGDFSHTRIGGLREDSFEVTFFSDFATSSVDATLHGLLVAGTPFNMTVKPTSAATSATNPIYSGSVVLVGDYTPFVGAAGDASQTTVQFPVASGTIHRATA